MPRATRATQGDRAGAKGDQGDQGDQGGPGAKGDQGDPGLPGVNGVQGDPGAKGDKGDQGDPGAKGDQGDPGAKGDQGDPGAKGDKGDKGDQGDTGPGLGGTRIVHSTPITHDKNTDAETTSVSCDADEVLVGGGGTMTSTDNLQKVQLTSSYPSASDTWTVTGAANVGNGKTWTIEAYAICAG